jgi:hypothetical protein
MRDLDAPWMADPVTVFWEGHYWEVTTSDGQTICNDGDIVAAFEVARKFGKYESPRLVVTPHGRDFCKVRFKGRVAVDCLTEDRLKWHEVIIPDQAIRDAVSEDGKRWERMQEEDDDFDPNA